MKFTHLPVLLIAASSLLFSACNEPSTIGVNVQPKTNKANVFFTDTMKLTASTVVEEPIVTSQNSVNLVGGYNDPVFGQGSASCYLQFLLPTLSFSPPATTGVDSLVLCLAYPTKTSYLVKTGYGDSAMSQTISVYQITEPFYHDSTYKSDHVFGITSIAVGSRTIVPNATDSVVLYPNRAKLPPHIRIRLNAATAQNLVFATKLFTDNSSFATASPFGFYGLYVKSTAHTGTGNVIYVDPNSIQTKLTLYVTGDTVPHDYVLSSASARVNHYEHDNYMNSPTIRNALMSPSVGNDLTYVQSMAGVKTKVKVPYLQNLKKLGKITINKAELVVTVDGTSLNAGDTSKYQIPPQLIVVGVDSVSKTVGSYFSSDNLILQDQQQGSGYFGGNTQVLNGKMQYHINLALHLQYLLNNPQIKDYGFYIVAGASGIAGNRVVLGGAKNPTFGMKLNLTYTKL